MTRRKTEIHKETFQRNTKAMILTGCAILLLGFFLVEYSPNIVGPFIFACLAVLLSLFLIWKSLRVGYDFINTLVFRMLGLESLGVQYSGKKRPKGSVYILSNPSLPGMVKIGMTSRKDASIRVEELNRATGIPTKFKIEYTHPSPDPYLLEQQLHEYFKRQRVNSRREFFTVTPLKVKKAIAKLESQKRRRF